MVTPLGTVRLVRPVQPEASSVVRPVQPETFRDVTVLGTVKLVRPVQPERFRVVTLLGMFMPVRLVQPESSTVCKLVQSPRFSVVKFVVHPFAFNIFRELLLEPNPAPAVVI